MKFDDFDAQMRIYEQSIDQCVLPDLYIVARIDGRSFTKLTKEICQFESPFDLKFHQLMVATTQNLMQVGFNIIYGYTQSDEISLLFHPQEQSFNRKVRKINSILAGEASAYFSLELGVKAAFDCRVVPLPNLNRVQDYFSWRQEDAHRNALNAHCYWLLRKEGLSQKDATQFLLGKSVAFKNEFLFQHGINFNELPAWQKRGTGVYFQEVAQTGFNPKNQQETITLRRKLWVDENLPLGEDYHCFIAKRFQAA